MTANGRGYAVAASRTPSHSLNRSLTHAVDWDDPTTICLRVLPTSRLDDDTISTDEPTCPDCVRRFKSIKAKRARQKSTDKPVVIAFTQRQHSILVELIEWVDCAGSETEFREPKTPRANREIDRLFDLIRDAR